MNRRLREFIEVVTTPACWLQNDPYSKVWDDELTWLLDNGYRFESISRYTAVIGDCEVWIGNHPYASFTFSDVRPRRATILRAGRIVLADRLPPRSVAHRSRKTPPAADAVDPHTTDTGKPAPRA